MPLSWVLTVRHRHWKSGQYLSEVTGHWDTREPTREPWLLHEALQTLPVTSQGGRRKEQKEDSAAVKAPSVYIQVPSFQKLSTYYNSPTKCFNRQYESRKIAWVFSYFTVPSYYLGEVFHSCQLKETTQRWQGRCGRGKHYEWSKTGECTSVCQLVAYDRNSPISM